MCGAAQGLLIGFRYHVVLPYTTVGGSPDTSITPASASHSPHPMGGQFFFFFFTRPNPLGVGWGFLKPSVSLSTQWDHLNPAKVSSGGVRSLASLSGGLARGGTLGGGTLGGASLGEGCRRRKQANEKVNQK